MKIFPRLLFAIVLFVSATRAQIQPNCDRNCGPSDRNNSGPSVQAVTDGGMTVNQRGLGTAISASSTMGGTRPHLTP
jgi:hypothetical protein